MMCMIIRRNRFTGVHDQNLIFNVKSTDVNCLV
uniref:Uncharacterized protein pNG7 n=1 Tax=African swine fever virus (strain Badajoz 1971 Vero-adapted) TaxID=10498 RepID=PNG7_ASFB7|nr:RecName: Full=Uncharacterized protein pNG7 [African swine fever virus BA71V]